MDCMGTWLGIYCPEVDQVQIIMRLHVHFTFPWLIRSFYGAIQTPPFNQENTFSVLPLVEIFIIKYSPKKHIKMLRAFAVEYGSICRNGRQVAVPFPAKKSLVAYRACALHHYCFRQNHKPLQEGRLGGTPESRGLYS